MEELKKIKKIIFKIAHVLVGKLCIRKETRFRLYYLSKSPPPYQAHGL